MIKKRYIYSSFLAGLLFILLYLFLNFNILLCLLFTFLSYIGGLFFFKEKDIRKYDPNLIMHYCYLISKLYNYTNFIKDEKINKNIEDITKESEKIITMLEQKPNKVTQVYDGFDYYLPLSIKVVDHFVYLAGKETLTNIEKDFMDNINSCLDNLELEIKKLLENMNYTKMIDITTRIEMFKKSNKIADENIIEKRSNNVEGR